jgi:hypothetical protein
MKNDLWRARLYFYYFICMAIGVPLGSYYSGAPDCKYIALITAAYLISVTSKNPENDLPTKGINELWLDTMFLFYGNVGNELTNDPYMLNAEIKWRSFVIIVVGLTSRFFATLTSTYMATKVFPKSIQTPLTFKERVYFGLAWSPKAAG